jgi:hypothetical protein
LTWKFIKKSLIVLSPSPKLSTNTILNGVWRFESLNANLILTFKIEKWTLSVFHNFLNCNLNVPQCTFLLHARYLWNLANPSHSQTFWSQT